MFCVTLPDGTKKEFDAPLSVYEFAKSIGPGLAKATIAGNVNGNLCDASDLIETDSTVRIITSKDQEGVEIIRHSCAHLIGHAVKQLYPNAKMVIGPVIEDGFYYDIAIDDPFSTEDLDKIEERMKLLIATEYDIVKEVTPRAQVIAKFEERNEEYKLRLIDDMPEETEMGLYYHQEYLDMCVGPHVPNTRFLSHFKLTKVSGAYWRGDSQNEMLQRIYGTAWGDKKSLKNHLKRVEESEKRDHRKLGRRLDLFHFSEEAPGSVFWHPKGWTLFLELLEYMRKRQKAANYVEVNTPDVMDRRLWETSGHWYNYREHMFSTQTEDERVFALKPMNCPGSVSMFAQGLKSYRDLPLRMAEFGKVHRYEPSGALHGLMRVRHFTQDDAHIYCTEQQMEQECIDVVKLVLDIYKDFGFEEIIIKLSTRPKKRIGTDITWDKLEGALSNALDVMELDYILYPGEGAFYGPKLEFVLRDAIGRDWQCGTLQVDMNLPERFDIAYVDENGNRDKRPVMLHRALFGSLERFTGILIEHYTGELPVWLAPIQVMVCNISDSQTDYVSDVAAMLTQKSFRVESDLRNEKVGFKIREHTLQKIPYLLIVGDREKETETVAVRARNGTDLGTMPIEKFTDILQSEVEKRGRIA
ncbi:MAG: threonine--tRNA ligase [Pseudomonadota bacterium]|nr:threonine--tRNA ligase [Pseudomonadota bacterium]